MRGPMVLALKPRELSDYPIPGVPQETQADPATRFVFVHGAPDLDNAKQWLEQVRGG